VFPIDLDLRFSPFRTARQPRKNGHLKGRTKMIRTRLLGTTAGGSAALIAFTLVALPSAASAQAAPANQAQPDCTAISDPQQRANCVDSQNTNPARDTAAAAPDSSLITVTGTRIRRPNLSSPVPITSVTTEELPDQGQASIGDALNELPSLRSTFSQQNSGAFIGTAGQNFLDLRGLGISRTLVLVNGRRHINSSPGDFFIDVNTIPQDLIQRIDVVTGGEAAIYGSDAVAGVVNFILRRDFTGLRFRVQDGISSRGDRPVHLATLTAGTNFADGRGNIAVSLEYTHAGALYNRDRDAQTGAFRGVCGFTLTENTVAESKTPSNSDGIPDTTFICGLHNGTISNGGTIGRVDAQGGFLRFDPAGNLFVDHGTGNFFAQTGGASATQVGGFGSTVAETQQLAVGQKRYVANLLAHFDFSPAFKPFFEATAVHQRVLQEGQPTFFQGSIPGFFGGGSNLRCNNPFLTSQALTTLQSFGVCANVATGTFTMSRFNVDFGGRAEIDKRDTFRAVAGIEGDFNGSWHYELSANYGRFQSTNAETHDLKIFDLNGNPDGFLLAIDAVRNAAGQIVCRVNQVTVTRPDCVPLNLFGQGQPTEAALNFVNTTSFLYSHATQLDIVGYVSGDTGKWFRLPGGPIGFSIGGEYRRETATQHADPLSAASGTFFNAFPRFDPPAFSVKEVYGELNVPIVKDVPLFHELTISGAARYSDYNTSAGNTFAWNINGVYSPVSDIRFRANYSRSVRVPTLTDLFSTPGINFGFVTDPCNANQIGGGPNRVANCAALGVPTTITASSPCAQAPFNLPVGSPFTNCIANAQTIQFLTGGNPNLKAEIGKSLTIGGVLTPRFLPGFSLTVDYFDIKVANLISVLGAQTILTQCVDQPTINNPFCALINPRTPDGLLQFPALLSSGVNFAKQTSRGVDFDLSYRHTFADGSRVNARGVMTLTLERNNFINPSNPGFAVHQLDTLGDPAMSANLSLSYGRNNWDLQWTTQWIGRMYVNAYEATHTFQGRAPTNPDATNILQYPNVFFHSVRADLKVDKHFRFYLGVNNIFDRLPPLGLTGTGAGSSIYSDIGRFFYGGAQVDF
jgi:outer membrane receptor protein involved in Fe transport